MPKAKPWTPTEDAIIRENAAMGPSWDGYELLLPNRTPNAIMSRRQQLGVQFERGGARGGSEPKRPRKKSRPLPDTGWTNEQNDALVRCAMEMTQKTNHSVRECVVQLARIVTAYRKAKG